MQAVELHTAATLFFSSLCDMSTVRDAQVVSLPLSLSLHCNDQMEEADHAAQKHTQSKVKQHLHN